MISRTYFTETYYDMSVDIATRFAQAIREAWLTGKDFEGEKRQGFFLSAKRGFEDKLYVGNIHRIENHLYWNDEELADDDEIVNVVVIDGPVTRDGDGCSYGSKDHRDQILYANTIPQVKGHIFILNTPGGAASARIDYEQAIADCRDKGKPTVAWVDGLCCSAGQLVAALCDRTIVMNGRNTMGCIGTMCAFWGVPHNTVDQDGCRYIELVSVTSPDKNAEYREAVAGDTGKLQAELDRLGEEFRETVRQNRPMVGEEHLTGKTFDAQDVMGALVDEVGGYDRAIEAVFELAGGTLPAAREVTVAAGRKEDAEEPEATEMSALSDRQKAAVASSPDETLMVGDGHVSVVVKTILGHLEQEIATPKNDNDMTDEEKKAAEAEAAQAAEQEEAPAAEQEEAPSDSPEGGVRDEQETPAEEAPAAEEEAPAEETETPDVEAPSDSPEGGEKEEEETPAGEETPAAEEEAPETPAEQPSEETVADAQAEIDRIADTLHSAQELLSQRDKTIAEMQAALETVSADFARQGEALQAAQALVAERDATIDALQKQLAGLKAEVRELASKPAPMTSADSGIPADNGTGDAPKARQPRIRRGMSYEQILEAVKEDRRGQ